MYPLTAGLVIETKELWDDVRTAVDQLPIRLTFELQEIPTEWPPFQERLDRLRPDVVLLDVTRIPERMEELVKRIRSTAGQPAVFALHTNQDPATILAAMRAGAREFLVPPVLEPLRIALERLAEERQHLRDKQVRGGKVIGFLGAKGGCGVTTVACHVAAALPEASKGRVLLADLDQQSGMIGFFLKIQSPYSIADAVNNVQRLDRSYWQGLISNGIPRLEVITAPTAPSAKDMKPGHLKQVIAFARGEYDWTVLDLGRNLNPSTLSLLEVVDETFLVVTQELPALHQAKAMIRILSDAGYGPHLRLILNRNTRQFEITLEELEKMLGAPIFATIENDFARLSEAFSEGHLVNSSSGIGEDFSRLAAKIAGVAETNPRKKKFSLFG
jgi:pilus assembly protein CpaE